MRLVTCLLFFASSLAFAYSNEESRFDLRDADGYLLAEPGVDLNFPRDHGSHPRFKTEWWYITGHLSSSEQDYGFQITFFRSAAKPDSIESGDQIYLAHAAILDKKSGQFIHEERINSGHWNADASQDSLDLYNGNWTLRMTDSDTENLKARFSLKDVGVFELSLNPIKEKVLFGDNGYSKKGDAVGAASYYITFPRLAVDGQLTTDGQSHSLDGLAWMDHEFSSSQLTADQLGWNWCSIILDDGSEVMVYAMRRKDGKTDPHSRLTVIDKDGNTSAFSGDEFVWTNLREWQSPHSGGVYPVEYEISWGSEHLRIVPFTDDQELSGAIGDFTYWEGACRVIDESGNQIGLAYTELTGYNESLYGKF